MIQRLLVLSVMLTTCFAWAAEKPAAAIPDFSGVWLIDPIRSHGDSIPRDTTVILIRQAGNELTFEHYATRDIERAPRAVEVFVADGRSKKRYSTRTQVAHARAKFDKGALVIDTTTTLDLYGAQSFSDRERWTLSPDGKTLTEKVSDGSVIVFHKEAAPPIQQ
ncbi:MAG: hypothetical protein ACE14L_04800 [Terriglobales bacterium]